ncbi:hypothetical protein EV361DRAFT_813114 [Lentinula raphanica]|nr:hypothetical protein F5880DRAFT_1494273 [Lentinula raphanica]KAJ3963702.1 hypothetical protein EV361DRAFT_813114 [Lentinula raphanica]
MIQVCQEREDQEGVELFQYLLRVVGKLKPGGMSEDEDGVDSVVTTQGVTIEESVKFTMIVPFRHSYFNDVLNWLDKLPGFEKFLFIQSGRVKKRRVRDDPRCKVSRRKPPQKWPQSFFDENYLEGMSELKRAKHVGKQDFELKGIDLSMYAN